MKKLSLLILLALLASCSRSQKTEETSLPPVSPSPILQSQPESQKTESLPQTLPSESRPESESKPESLPESIADSRPESRSESQTESQPVEILKKIEAQLGVPVKTQAKSTFHWKGDLNADGVSDDLYFVFLNGNATQVLKDIKVLRPWEYKPLTHKPNEVWNQTPALFIVHGVKTSTVQILSSTPPSAPAITKYLLLDTADAEASILGTPLWKESPELPIEIIARKNKTLLPEYTPPGKSDVIVQTTEMTDGVIYWDGKTYRWKEDPSAEGD